jgi:hypothetical protein
MIWCTPSDAELWWWWWSRMLGNASWNGLGEAIERGDEKGKFRGKPVEAEAGS